MSKILEGFEKRAYIGIDSKGGIAGLAGGSLLGGSLAAHGADAKTPEGAKRIQRGVMAGATAGTLAGHYLQHGAKGFKKLRIV